MESLELNGTWGADTVTAGALADQLDGRAGNDQLRGGGGNDLLLDGDGNDVLLGDAGDDDFVRTDADADGGDRFDGGAGVDTLFFDIVSGLSVKVDLADSTLNGGLARGLTLSGIERVVGSDLDDDIRGSTGADTFWGGKGDDRLEGRAGDDNLVGGGGGDVLIGGAGRDHFIFGADATGSGDLITDFTRGQDKLGIDRAAFGMDADDVLSLVVGTAPAASGSGPQFLFETGSGRLWFDADGAGTGHEAVLMATLTGVTTLSGSDFALG
jgi:Ca2+-binding RTX toxin-like protein